MKITRLNKHLYILFPTLLLHMSTIGQLFTANKTEQGIEILEKGKKVLFFQVKPTDFNGKYERSGYVHPLYDLNENIITDDRPADHPYHNGIFWAWHQVLLNDDSVGDGWTSENIAYVPVNATVKSNKKKAVIESSLLWKTTTKPQQELSLVKQQTKITIHKSQPGYRIFDFDVQLFALQDNLKIGGSEDPKGYGGFCLRLKLPDNISFVSGNSQIEPQETPVNAGPWMTFKGSLAGKPGQASGVTIFGYTGNNGEPYPWILRKVTSMQNVPYPGRTPVLLSKKGLRLHYRVVVHNSDLTYDDIEKLYKEYLQQY